MFPVRVQDAILGREQYIWSLPALPGYAAAALCQRRPFLHTYSSAGVTRKELTWPRQVKCAAYLCVPIIVENGGSCPKEQAANYRRSCCCNGTVLVTERAFSLPRAAQIPFLLAERSLRLSIPFPSLPGEAASNRANTPHIR